MAIRTAVPGDLTAVMRIARQGFTGDDRFGTVWLIKKLAEPGTRLMVDDPGCGVIRGFLLTQTYDLGCIVRLIATEKGFRGQGVALGLAKTVTGPAGAWVRVENTASRKTFEKAGWTLAVEGWAEAKRPEKHSGDWVFYTKGA